MKKSFFFAALLSVFAFQSCVIDRWSEEEYHLTSDSESPITLRTNVLEWVFSSKDTAVYVIDFCHCYGEQPGTLPDRTGQNEDRISEYTRAVTFIDADGVEYKHYVIRDSTGSGGVTYIPANNNFFSRASWKKEKHCKLVYTFSKQ